MTLTTAIALTAGFLVTGPADGPNAIAAGAATASPSPTPTPPPVWTATAVHPVRVWVGGDSLGGELVWGLVPPLQAAGSFRTSSFYKESSGICRYDFFNWRSKMTTVMTRVRPHAVAIMLGANDTQSVWTPSGWTAYGTSEWKRAYGMRVGALMDTMLRGGARRVYWVGMPIMRQSWRNARMKAINGVLRQEAGLRPGVRFVDIWRLFADADGRYVAKWRAADGVHFSTIGWRRLGRRVYRSLAADWLPPATPASASPTVAAP